VEWRKRTVAGGDGDCDGSGDLGAEAARCCHLAHGGAQAANHLVAEEGKTNHDANTT